MWIEIGNTFTRVGQSTRDEIRWLAELLSFEDQSKTFYRDRRGKTVRRKGGPGKVCMYSHLTQSFPAGLTAMVYEKAKLDGVALNILDNRTKPGPVDPNADLGWLHDFQRKGVDIGLQRTKGIWHVATSGGKTEMAVALMRATPDVNWLLLAPEKDLMHNAARRWEKRTGEPAGLIGDGILSIERVTAATFQTLAYKLGYTKRGAKGDSRIDDQKVREFVNSVGGLIFDEVHQLPADTFYNVAMGIPNAYYRIGMSGTPLVRGDRKSLMAIAATGNVIYTISSKYLIDNGFASKPTIYVQPHECEPGKHSTWQKAYKQLITVSQLRNEKVAQAAIVCEKPALVFVKEIDHGRALTRLLGNRGLKVEFVWGDSKTPVRDRMIELLEWGDLDCIVCSVVFNTGTDIPEVRSIINAAAGKSIIQTLQRIGRGMRVTWDSQGELVKTKFTVYDFQDKGNTWLAKWARERLRSYMSEGHDVRLVDTFTNLGQV